MRVVAAKVVLGRVVVENVVAGVVLVALVVYSVDVSGSLVLDTSVICGSGEEGVEDGTESVVLGVIVEVDVLGTWEVTAASVD